MTMLMKYKVYAAIFFIVSVRSLILDTNGLATLDTHSQLTSALGIYKAKLLKNCSFLIQKFNTTGNKYQNISVLNADPELSQCSSVFLQLNEEALMSNNRQVYQVYKKITGLNLEITRMKLKITDKGELNIISYFKGPDSSTQVSVSPLKEGIEIDKSPQKNILFELRNFANYKNRNQWSFILEDKILSINKTVSNSPVNRSFNLTRIQLGENGLTDSFRQTRLAIVPGMTWKSKCSHKSCRTPQGVFLQFDRFWPVARVYDEDGYIVAEYKIEDQLELCPENTFSYNNQCLINCPDNYYKQIGQSSGRCVLACPKNLITSKQLRTCIQSESPNTNTILDRICPPESSPYQYGCFCKVPFLYDFDLNKCIEKCRMGHFSSSGICMKCPSNCKTCRMDNTQKSSFLDCQQCQEGFQGSKCLKSKNLCSTISNCQACDKSSAKQICKKCSPFYALSSNKTSCSLNCSKQQLLVLGNSGEGYCIQNSLPLHYVGGIFQNQPFIIRKSQTCPLYVFRDRCVERCPENTKVNNESRCICRNEKEATFINDSCMNIKDGQKNLLGFYYNFSLNNFVNCPLGCLSCQNNFCLKCSSSYVLVVTLVSATCRQNSLTFNCESEFYTYYPEKKICLLKKAIINQQNIQNCEIQIRNYCIRCKDGYYKQNGHCVKDCGLGYEPFDGLCIKSIQGCHNTQIRTLPIRTLINYSVLQSGPYNIYSSNFSQISNDPITEILVIRSFLGIKQPGNQLVETTFYETELSCRIRSPALIIVGQSSPCKNHVFPYLMLNGDCVQSCPPNHYIHNTKQSILFCVTYTKCAGKNKEKPFELENGTCVSECPSKKTPVKFGGGEKIICVSLTSCQKQNIKTPIRKSLDSSECITSCQSDEIVVEKENDLYCEKRASGDNSQKIYVDCSVINLNDIKVGQPVKIFYFVVNSPLNKQKINVNFYQIRSKSKLQSSGTGQERLGQSSDAGQVAVTEVKNSTFIAINTTADLVVLDFTRNIKQFTGPGNKAFIASSIYGVESTEDRSQNLKSWLAIVSYFISLIAVLFHTTYIGSQLFYKLDNYIIFIQSLFYIPFAKLMINSPVVQFYYGFLWSHLGFFPNFFSGMIPEQYMEGFNSNKDAEISNSFRLFRGDANLIRNCGFTFSLLISFLALYLVVLGILFLMYKVFGKYEIWDVEIIKNIPLLGFEFSSMNIFYWSLSHILSNRFGLFSQPDNPFQNQKFRESCSIAAILWLVICLVYMILRFLWNNIAGLYMFKRLSIAAILAGSSYLSDSNNGIFFIIILLEFFFMFLRMFFEDSIEKDNFQKRFYIFISLQSFLFLIGYVTIFAWNDTGFVSIYISLLMFFFYFLLTADLIDVYLDNRDQYYDDDFNIIPGLREKQNFLKGQNFSQLQSYIPESDRKLRNQ